MKRRYKTNEEKIMIGLCAATILTCVPQQVFAGGTLEDNAFQVFEEDEAEGTGFR